MIVIEYVEKIVDQASGAVSRTTRGIESHDQIDEVLLPSASTPNNPVFMTRKFSGISECRWQVDSVIVDAAKPPTTYVVELFRREQAPKECYLRTILRARNIELNRLLHKNDIVEIEYGHSMEAGDGIGRRADSRRYVDTVQKGSMPKRRLAIVNQIISGLTEDLVQVIPISSKAPRNPASRRAVEVTSCLTSLVHYQRQSWAICDMLETVSPNRIMAPLRRELNARGFSVEKRDSNFATKISMAIRQELNDALLCSVDQEFRMVAVSALQSREANLRQKIAVLQSQEQILKERVAALEGEKVSLAAYFGVSPDDLQKLSSPAASINDTEESRV